MTIRPNADAEPEPGLDRCEVSPARGGQGTGGVAGFESIAAAMSRNIASLSRDVTAKIESLAGK